MRYFYVKITAGNSTSTYTIYYSINGGSNSIANKYNRITNTTVIATGITYEELTLDDGLLIEVPKNVSEIILDDEVNGICQTLSIGVGPSATLTITDATCDLGSITVSNLTGGTSPYLIQIGSINKFANAGSTTTFSYLQPGSIEVVITDSSANPKIFRRTVEIFDETLTSEIEIISYPSTTSSSDGIIKLKSYGGTYNKTYYLYKNTNYPDEIECTYTTTTKTITGVTETTLEQTVTGLTCGAYCFRVIDNSFCESQTQLVEVCSTPLQPPVFRNRISVRYGGTETSVCENANALFVFSETDIFLVNGGIYTDISGNPINGEGGGYYKNTGDLDCSYGTIDAFGEFTVYGTCTNCA